MPKRSGKKPRDANQLGKAIVDQATGQASPEDRAADEQPKKNPAAVELGKLGGKKGGPARAKKLTQEQRSEIAKKAAQSRWSRRRKPLGG